MRAAAPAVTLDDVREAAVGLAGIAVRTPLIDAPFLGRRLGHRVALKAEFLQPMGAFKIRGAMNAVGRLAPAERARGLVTSSSGNHGQAIAFAGRHFGVRAVVVMPESAPAVKVDGVRRLGGEVVFAGKTRSAEQMDRALQLAAAEGLALIPPYDHPDVIAGQGTCALEIVDEMPELSAVLSPVSGGGLLAGTCLAVQARTPAARVIAVEPVGAAKLSAAMAAGAPVRLARVDTMADGLQTPSIGALTFPIIRDLVAEVVQVSEDEIAGAVRALHQELHLTVEPSGAVTVAALLSGRVAVDGPVAAIVSGGNVDPAVFQRLVRG
ncbi:MAG TPA: threonine/serine dehydratase [Gemmatimonadales bacterium]|nr:threonine/serine dehydratase [Gemmatimonadales bacterium]